MNAETLRGVPALMRVQARDAVEGTGSSDWFSAGSVVRSSGGMVCEASSFEAPHIASWHPGVALAVADWLEAEFSHQYGPTAEAIDVAAAYLGEVTPKDEPEAS